MMTKRFVVAASSAVVLAAHASMAGLTVIGITAKMVDCYADPDLQKENGPVIEKKDWPVGRLTVERESEDGVFLTVNGRPCWFDRSQLDLDVPSPNECGTPDQYGSRGLGADGKSCPKAKDAKRR